MAAVGIEARIAGALLSYIGQIVTSPATRIAMPGVGFTPQIGVPYLAATIMPNTADLFGVEFDSDTDYQGLAQVSVFWPAGQGIIKPSQIASQVAAVCAPGTKIDADGFVVRIDQKPVVAGALVEPDWLHVPVTVRWRAFVPVNA